MTTTNHGFDRHAVDRFLAAEPDVEENRPAMRKLSKDGRELLARWVDGFDSRREFLEWAQDASVAFLGELPDEWAVRRAFTRTDLQALVVSPSRRQWADVDDETGEADLMSLDRARFVRRGVAATELLPAGVRATRSLRWSAVEYVNDDDTDVGPSPSSASQKHPAMRPALTEIDERQEFALRSLLDGFDTDDELLTWVQVVTEASYAEVDVDLGKRCYLDRATRDILLDREGCDPHAEFYRESIAAKYLLPAFNRAVRSVAERAGEAAQTETKTDHSPIKY